MHAREKSEKLSLYTNRRETRTRRCFRARTALALSSAFTSCTRVLNRPNAQMCCWSSHVTSSALLPCSDTRARRGRGSASEIGHDLFAQERRTRLKGRRARAIDRTRGPGKTSKGRTGRERNRAGIVTHAHVGLLPDEFRTHHSRAARSAERPVRVLVCRARASRMGQIAHSTTTQSVLKK